MNAGGPGEAAADPAAIGSAPAHQAADDLTADDLTADDLAAIERAMVRIRRNQTRRMLGRVMREQLGAPADLSHAMVVDAVEEAAAAPDRELTVGVVGEQLGIDPSRASRLVASAIAAGYVSRVASQQDARRIRLELTGEGRRLARQAREFRLALFDRLMEGWTSGERHEFARLLTKFTDAVATLRDRDAGAGRNVGGDTGGDPGGDPGGDTGRP
jgi:DNA-binding MarR family transcriptional regulator